MELDIVTLRGPVASVSTVGTSWFWMRDASVGTYLGIVRYQGGLWTAMVVERRSTYFTGQVNFLGNLPTFFTAKNDKKNCNLLALLNSLEAYKINCGNRYQLFSVFQANLLNENEILAITV